MSWDGKIYNKYRIAHMDGTPLKGEKYFVLRLDSDYPVEAARVAAAMRAYKGEPRNCDVGTVEEQGKRFTAFCYKNRNAESCCGDCPAFNKRVPRGAECELTWAQMPYEKGVPNAEEKEKSC